jgi:hypothetical protein
VRAEDCLAAHDNEFVMADYLGCRGDNVVEFLWTHLGDLANDALPLRFAEHPCEGRVLS